MPINLQGLSQRFTGIIQGLVDPRTLPQQLVWSARIPEVPADDDEIMARFIGYMMIADLVSDDQPGRTYSTGKLQYESYNIPNLKIGTNLTGSMIRQLRQISRSSAGAGDTTGFFSNNLNWFILALRQGVAWRKESLLIAMLTDSWDYDRGGIKISGGTWGMPADLKVTTSVAWSDAANATPVDDILLVALVAKVRYGLVVDRLSMSTPAFREMIATAEFQAKAKVYIPPQLTFSAIPLENLQSLRNLAQNVLGMGIEFADARYTDRGMDGVITYVPLQPLNKVLMTSTQNDGVQTVYDFANGECMEAVVSDIIGGPVQGGDPYGPIAYVTGDDDLNPAQLTAWAVQRGFPRRHVLQSSACLDVGAVTDTISTSAPF